MDRLLVFRIDGRPTGLSLARVHGIARIETIRPVPGAPPGVAGLTEWRGKIVTLLDTTCILTGSHSEDEACLVALTDTSSTALLVPLPLEVRTCEPSGGTSSEAAGIDLLDPDALIRSVTEAATAGSPRETGPRP